eukprot:TRINITY_DN5020_c0_g1_i1.p1 TRINITY_DN5020_c0_g1~~TRINITY_DN5020_c0_g1_i1.p1  ORF type:complete len:1201 (+),score=436.93 TRINITY_DN5020_c0_g1_i1:35-3637(+)
MPSSKLSSKATSVPKPKKIQKVAQNPKNAKNNQENDQLIGEKDKENVENSSGKRTKKNGKFLKIFESEDVAESLVSFVETYNNKEKKGELEEMLEVLTQSEVSQVFSKILAVLEAFGESEEVDSKSLHFYKTSAFLSELYISKTNRRAPNSLLQVAQQLHDNIFRVQAAFEPKNQKENSELISVLNQMSSVCELWWTQSRPDREQLVPQMISYLLVRVLDEGSKVADITKLNEMRSTLSLIDFDDESSISLRKLLLRCFLHPLLLKNKKGMNFLTQLFALSTSFVEEIHATIKAQLFHSRKGLSKVYGELYFEAWRNATGPFLLKIEYSCIQDLMSSAINVSDSTLSESIRNLLSVFHAQKNTNGVDEVLFRLYSPILWRSLKVANAQVRRNAACILVDAFPLQNPESSAAEIDEWMQKQFTLLQELLFDDSDKVRASSIHGICRIMSVWWELIPEQSIRILLHNLLGKLINDKSSNLVRIAVLEGITFLLDNHLSQPMLKIALVKLGDLVNDSSEGVRSAFFDMLAVVKNIKLIRYYEIVNVEDLLTRMTKEKPVLAKKIANLLLNSYCPHSKPSSVQIKRCLVLIRSNPSAIFPFYTQAAEILPVSASSKLISSLWRFAHLNKEIFAGRKGEGSEVSEVETICLIEIAAVLFQVIAPKLGEEGNSPFKRFLSEVFSEDSLLDFAVYAEDNVSNASHLERVMVSLASLSSHLDGNSIQKFVRFSIQRLQKSPKENKNSIEIAALLRSVFAWNEGQKALNSVNGWIEKVQSIEEMMEDEGEKRKKKSSKSSKNLSEIVNSAKSGLVLLDLIMCDEESRQTMFTDATDVLKLMNNLQGCLTLIERRMEGMNLPHDQSESLDSLLTSSLKFYCKLLIHISALPGVDKNEPLEGLIKWAVELVLPAIQRSEEESAGKRKKSAQNSSSQVIAFDSAETIYATFTECLTLYMCDSTIVPKVVDSVFRPILSIREISVLRRIVPNAFKAVYQLFNQGHRNQALSLLSCLLLELPVSFFKDDLQHLKLHELIQSLNTQGHSDSLLGELVNTLQSLLPEEDLGEDGKPRSNSDIIPELIDISERGQYILTEVARSVAGVTSLSNALSQQLVKYNFSVACMEFSVKIASLIVETREREDSAPETARGFPKKKTDLSPLCNCMISVVAKLPTSRVDDLEADEVVRQQKLKKHANHLLNNILHPTSNNTSK